jgi:tRNA (adenine37-N6)-methyltransferase
LRHGIRMDRTSRGPAIRSDIRPNELAVEWREPSDAALLFIGVIRTPWLSRRDCPHYGAPDGPLCRIEVYEPWGAGLDGIELFERLEVLYWLHQSRRDLVRQNPGNKGVTKGTFAIRSPARPNPIGTSIVAFVGREGSALTVRGLDCVDGTPLLDLKPDRSQFRSAPAPQARPGSMQQRKSEAAG